MAKKDAKTKAKLGEMVTKNISLTEEEARLVRRAIKGKKVSKEEQKVVDGVAKRIKRLGGKK